MVDTHLIRDELVWIDTYYHQGHKVSDIAKHLQRALQTIYNVVNFLKAGGSAISYYARYKQNKAKFGRRKVKQSTQYIQEIKDKLTLGWTPDTIIGRGESDIPCSIKTLYRLIKDDDRFNAEDLRMQGKRKPNHHQEKRGKQSFRRGIKDREKDHPNYKKESGHLEGDTIVGLERITGPV